MKFKDLPEYSFFRRYHHYPLERKIPPIKSMFDKVCNTMSITQPIRDRDRITTTLSTTPDDLHVLECNKYGKLVKRTVPYTLDSFPKHLIGVLVKSIHDPSWSREIKAIGVDGVWIGPKTMFYTPYDALLSNYTFMDDSPCGIEVTQ